MRIEEINSYDSLQRYIRIQMATQLATKRIVAIELPEEWFFKLWKLVQFCLKYNPTELKAKEDIFPECKKMTMKVNKVFTIVTRK